YAETQIFQYFLAFHSFPRIHPCRLAYVSYNFVGRILGPRGMTAKQLEEDTGCKIMVRGRGSSRTVCFLADTEPLHVLIQCEDYEKRAHQKMRNAVEAVNQLLHPPVKGKDELKRKQLIELSIINGTYRPTSATKVALPIRLSTNLTITEAPRPLSAPNLPPVADNSPYNEQARMFSQFAEAARFRKKKWLMRSPPHRAGPSLCRSLS
ncbi:unnamed protein product, partial [Angiostrongylus costaricensis]|uniref:KH domain-containing protein n=1 Tax=Angiostrongylus costaricensis TaxID=334426 RepID=A0A0R3PUZ1_ANGCS